ncbi:MAG: FG-GAP-like repeat-containing protein, partial [Thermoplasmata archaeon]
MRKYATLMIFFLGVIAGTCGGAELERGEELLARREYSKAIRVYQEILAEKPVDTLALKALALVYSKKRDWEKAAQAWEDLVKLDPDNLEANSERWFALIQASKDDSTRLNGVKEAVREEALSFIETLDDRETALALAYDGLRIAEADSARVAEIERAIVKSFPQSRKAYEIAREKFFDGLYPIWRDDTLKVAFLDDFLREYQVKDWRYTVYQYLLSSLKRLDDADRVRQYGERMLREDSLNPFAYDYLSYILLEMKVDTSRALELAMRAVQLEPGYSKPVNKPREQWELEKGSLPGTARREVAVALMAMRKLNEAEQWIKDAVRVMRPSVNDYATRASLFYTLGRIQEKKGEDDSALRSYVQALIEGDMTNKWTEKADSALKVLYARRFGSERGLMEYARSVSAYSGITFTDVTEEVGLAGRKESRVAWSDFNNDGYDDIILSGKVLFLNSEGNAFIDYSDESGIAGSSANGAVCADFDNDGNMDIFATAGGKGEKTDRLWKGRGDGTFVDLTETAGAVSDTFPTEGAAWGDYDADGHIDLYCANYEIWRQASGLPDFL